MLILSNLLSKSSGSLNGLVGSHNKGGMYLRQRSTPTNPATSFQQAVRNSVRDLTSRWNSTLTQAQRTSWYTYAANVALINRLGEAKNIPGLSMYTRCNVPRLQAGRTRIDDAPTNFSLGTFTDPTFAVVAATGIVTITFTNTDSWASTGGALLVWASRPQQPTIVFFKGPFRFLNSINGAAVPPTSPATATSPFTIGVGNRLFFRVRATQPDGRLSSDRFYSAVAA